jgi:hypothetical protein
MRRIFGVIKRGAVHSRVLYLQGGRRMSARVPNNFLANWAFPSGVEDAPRPATKRDQAHELVSVGLVEPVRVCQNHSLYDVMVGGRLRGRAVIDNKALPGPIVEVESRCLR